MTAIPENILDDYQRAKQILIELSLDEGRIKHIEPRSKVEWFAVSEFFREK